MKVLWVTNTIFPDLSEALGNTAPVVGGWMYGMAKDLSNAGISLIVATSRPQAKEYKGNINGITYYLLRGALAYTEYDATLESKWKQLIDQVQPDLVHIHGTEYAHGLALVKAMPQLNYVCSIQGLISVYARYYTGHIPHKEIQKNRTFRDLIKNDGILASQQKFYKRGDAIEKEYFKRVLHFIGRTTWDKEHTLTLGSNSTYHFCNESLRDSFYTAKKWDSTTQKEHTIFLSQAGYPIKGLHQVLKAVYLIKEDFPNLKIRIAGNNITKSDSFKDRLKIDGYGKYILRLIQSLGLHKHIEFAGYLNEEQMVEEYLNCHTFICPSSIENSPNSLGEAQLLGVPCIAAYVGGVPDMVTHGETGLLYRFEEVEMMAQAIRAIFTQPSLAEKLSLQGLSAARVRHDRKINLQNTIEIYTKIVTLKP